MNTFKDAVENDLTAFFDTRNLASVGEVEGVLLPCSSRHFQTEMSGRLRDVYDGLHGDHLQLSFRASDFLLKKSALPRDSQIISFNGRQFKIVRSQVEYGVCRLILKIYGGVKR